MKVPRTSCSRELDTTLVGSTSSAVSTQFLIRMSTSQQECCQLYFANQRCHSYISECYSQKSTGRSDFVLVHLQFALFGAASAMMVKASSMFVQDCFFNRSISHAVPVVCTSWVLPKSWFSEWIWSSAHDYQWEWSSGSLSMPQVGEKWTCILGKKVIFNQKTTTFHRIL